MKKFDYKNDPGPELGQLKCKGCGNIEAQTKSLTGHDCEICGDEMKSAMWNGWKENPERDYICHYVSEKLSEQDS